jgi:hypothetical protein
MGKYLLVVPLVPPEMSREENILGKTVSLKFVDHEITYQQPFSEMDREKYLDTERVSYIGDHINANIKLYTDFNRLNNRFEGKKFFMTTKEKEPDQDPTEREVAQKLASYPVPKLNLKEIPRDVGKEEDGIRLKKPQRIIDREDDYRKRCLIELFFLVEVMIFPWETRPPMLFIQTYPTLRWEEAFKREKEENLRLIAKKYKGQRRSTRKCSR